jgi:uncharacterized protein (TIGR02172 family)
MGYAEAHPEDGNLTISISGHIDSTNAPALEEEINALRRKHPEGHLTLDALKLEYISSAGLRVILRLSQAEEELKVINVSSAVYEIFEMTGFTEMIHVEKAYRTISVEGCEVIGQGSNGKVYRLNPETIIKVYNNPDALPEIHRETELARKAFVLGIPTAIPFDVVKVGNGYGSVFELLNAKSFSKLIMEDPSKLDTYVKLYVELLKKIHNTEVTPADNIPDIKQIAENWAGFLKDYLPAEQSEKLNRLIEAVPEVNRMIHGDYHTKNVMMQNGEVLLIDMDTISRGHPIFEIASMYLGFVGFGEVDHSVTQSFMGLPYEIAGEFFHKSLRMYLGTEDEKRVQEVQEKAMIIGCTRLMRRTIKRIGLETPEGKPIVENCRRHLGELLARYDNLDF